MELITANVIGKARKATTSGREYLVAPATLIVPGILEGSQGALLYEAPEIRKSVRAWNGMPLVGYHPVIDGVPASARDPLVLEKHGIGAVYNAAFADRLTADLWFDLALTRAFDETLAAEHRVIPRLLAGQPIEVSTGLNLERVPAAEGAVHNGRPYAASVRNLEPDHVAALPDQTGACGVKDGCGVFNRAQAEAEAVAQKKTLWSKLGELLGLSAARANPAAPLAPVANEMSHEQLRDALQKALKSRFTQDEPYCYVCEVFDDYFVYEQGMKSYRLDYTKTDSGVEVSGDPVEVMREINYVPTGEGGAAMSMNKAQTIEWLVANCDCWKGQQGHETLNKLQDDQLAKLKAAAEKAKADELVANKAREPQTLPDGSSLVWNAEKQTWEHKPKPAEVPKPAETPAASAVNRLTAEEQDDLAFARAERMRQKQAMIDRLTANVADALAKAAAHAVYAAMKPEQLAPLVNALQAGTTQSQQQPLAYAPSWGGAVPPPVANAKDDSDNLLPPMVFDFEAEAEQRRKQLQKQA